MCSRASGYRRGSLGPASGSAAAVSPFASFGSLLIWVGASASTCNLSSLVVVGALLAGAYAYRIMLEERMLVGVLGDAYREYRRHSWRLVPFVF
jgi:protein-S-isoprenylcysteine O-methyltransferase Ste14